MITDERPGEPLFSIVSAVYNVSRYLDDFFGSLERQTVGMGALDIVLVDDGSTDDSLAACQAFAARWPASVRVLTQRNAGQGSARNAGLSEARGTWVTFTDPDDFLAEDYFERVADSLAAWGAADLPPALVSTSLRMFRESTGAVDDGHPLQGKFRHGSRVIDLAVESDHIQLHCSSALFRRELLERGGIRFDERIRPLFEDAHFVSRYLLESGSTLLGAVATARYNYRKRADASSSVDTGAADPDRYLTVPRFGYLPLLRTAVERGDSVPEWLQNTVLYDLAWCFKDDAAVKSATGSLDPAVADEFHELVRETLHYIEPRTIGDFHVTPLNDDLRFTLLHGYRDGSAVSPAVRLAETDQPQKLVKVVYHFTGTQPDEVIHVDGVPVLPAHSKSRSLEYHRRTLAHERILWLPAGRAIRIHLNGQPARFQHGASAATRVLAAEAMQAHASGTRDPRHDVFANPAESLLDRAAARFRRAKDVATVPALFELAIATALHSAPVRRAFKNAWVFMDKEVLANDNAEHLYRYVRTHHPEINSWFVLSRTSPDWNRLRAEGFRLVPYGSWRWQLLMLSADHVASSHADLYITRPLAPRRFGHPRWRFTFLQHGVIQNDMSRWLNTKKIDLLVTASKAEYESLVADGTPYAVTSKEVALTGLPRHDLLIRKREATPENERRAILVMPTWRSYLVGEQRSTANDRARIAGFGATEYARQYSALLGSTKVQDLAAEHGLTVVFMPHPNMAPYLGDFDYPPNVEVHSYADTNVQDLVARAAVMLTDYSSVAFDAARIGVPVVYFQFDRADMFAGAHVARKGYFDYAEQGFGPVCDSVAQVEESLPAIVDGRLASRYRDRMQDTFAHSDTNNCERVFDAMLALNAPQRSAAPATRKSGTQ